MMQVSKCGVLTEFHTHTIMIQQIDEVFVTMLMKVMFLVKI